MVVEQFFSPLQPVSLVAVGDSGEAMTLRLILESLGAFVSYYPVGTPGDFLAVLSTPNAVASLIIISAHGADGGFHFGDYGPGIDVSTLKDGELGPQVIRTTSNPSLPIILSTACGTGTSDMQQAFLSAGARAFIAPGQQPEARDLPLFVHLFARQLLVRQSNISAAFEAAKTAITDAGMTLALAPQA